MTDTSSATELWSRVQATTQQALASGALQPISTQASVLQDGKIPFVVRQVDSLRRKDAAHQSQNRSDKARSRNPFLPYEEALFVENVSKTHLCLLNKYNVVPHHLLIVTRQYESQQEWLTLEDFTALAYCLSRIDGLGFYNSGEAAGASQHHKHLQLVPYESEQGTQPLPITAAIAPYRDQLSDLHRLPQLPFWHSIRQLSPKWADGDRESFGLMLLNQYQQIMADLGFDRDTERPAFPYNLLVTREWMIGVRRSQASYQGINVNSLGYAGWLLVKTADDFDTLRHLGPLKLLAQVGEPQL